MSSQSPHSAVPAPSASRLRGALRNPLIQFGIAILAVVVAWLLERQLLPLIGAEAPYLFFALAVLLAAGVGGLAPGLVATALGTVVILLVRPPTRDWPTDTVRDALNARVGAERIAVLAAERAAADFDARFSAVKRPARSVCSFLRQASGGVCKKGQGCRLTRQSSSAATLRACEGFWS